MDININLNQQSELRFGKRAYIIGSVAMLALSVASVFALILESKLFLAFYPIYFLGFAIVLYFNSKGKNALDLLGHSYLRLDEKGFSCKMDFFSKKIIQLSWDDIQEIKMKLFEVQIKTKGTWISVNLEKLSDDNLKLVKNAFQDFQKRRAGEAQLSVLA